MKKGQTNTETTRSEQPLFKMVDQVSSDASSGNAMDNDYVSRAGQKDHTPVQKDEDPVENPIDPETADSDKTLGKCVFIGNRC